MKNKMLIISIGQAGGNIAKELYDRQFNVLAINSSTDDLNALDIPDSNKFHIKNGEGTSKNRDLSKQLVKDIIPELISTIEEKYANIKYIHLVSSLGGGTGGGSIAAISNLLASKFKDKSISLTVILPSSFENFRIKNNAIAAFTELSTVQDKIGPIFVLSNEKVEKFKVNEMHADVLQDIINLRSVDARGSLDARELQEIWNQKGVMLPYTVKNSELELIDCYIDIKGTATLTALSLSTNFNQDILYKFETEKGLNITHRAYRQDNKDYVFFAGITLNISPLSLISQKLKNEINILQEQANEDTEMDSIEVYNLNITTKTNNIKALKIDAVQDNSDVYDLFNTKKKDDNPDSFDNFFSF